MEDNKFYMSNYSNENYKIIQTSKKVIGSSGNSIVFAPTNGVGLGHLTRLLAIARRVKNLEPEKEIIFFATSVAMHLIFREGFLGYYIPSRRLYPKDMTFRQWNSLLKKQLNMVLQLHQPSMLVFDGVYPYEGLISSMEKSPNLKRIWVKRSQLKKERKIKLKEKENKFHHIIVPGEAAAHHLKKETVYHYYDPVIYLDKSELLDREDVLKQLQIPNGYKVIYVQLGAGNINEIESTISELISVLKKRKDIFIVIGESIIGKRINITHDRVLILRDYPNSRFFKGFDLAISAVGYNTYHELMYFGIPSIFIPNEKTGLDDQIGRAMNAKKSGIAMMLRNPKAEDFEKAIEKIFEKENDYQMRKKTNSLIKRNGADQIARFLLNL